MRVRAEVVRLAMEVELHHEVGGELVDRVVDTQLLARAGAGAGAGARVRARVRARVGIRARVGMRAGACGRLERAVESGEGGGGAQQPHVDGQRGGEVRVLHLER